MASVMKWRSTSKLVERACLPSMFGAHVSQEDDLTLNPYSKEFIPQSNQRQLDYHTYPTQSMILNPSAEEFIPQLIKSLPKKTLMFNPSAEEFIPQLIKSLPKQTLMFNASAEEFTPRLIKSLPRKTLMFNPSAEEFIPQLIKSLPKQTLMFKPSAEEFTPQLIKSLPKKTLMFNPSAKEFIPQLIKSLPKQTLMFNPSAEEFIPQKRKSHPKKTLMFNISAEEFTPRLIKSLPRKTLKFNPSAEEFIPHLNDQSVLKTSLMVNPSAGEITPQLSGKSHPKKTLMIKPSSEECIPKLISLSLPKSTVMFNPNAESQTLKTYCGELRNYTSEETTQNVPQNHSALDVCNTPVTSNAGGSLILPRNKDEHRPRKSFIDERNGDVPEVDNQTSGHSQEESQSRRSRNLNPSAKPFVSLVRNASPSSRNTNETSAILEQKYSELDPLKSSLTQKLKELLRKLVSNSRLAPKESFRKRLDENTEKDVDDAAQTAGNSRDPQFTESQKLNSSAQMFIPHPTDMSPVLLKTEDKNYNPAVMSALSNVDKRPTSFELTAVSSVCAFNIAHVIEDSVKAEISCPSQEDHFHLPTHQAESSTFNPNVKRYMPLFRNMSQVSQKVDSCNVKNSGELSETSLHNTEIHSECAPVSYELNLGEYQPSLSADDNAESGSVLNPGVAVSSSTHAQGDISTRRSTTVTAAERTIADVNNLTPTKVNNPNGDFRRTPRRPNKRPMPHSDEFTDNPSQQFSAWLEHGATVTDEADHDPTNLAFRLEKAETEANRLRLKVSTMTTEHALASAQHQLQIKILHKQMATDKKALANMQVLMLDLMKQVAINRVDKKLMRAELYVPHLYETMGDRVSASEMQDTYQMLSSYMTECNVMKLEIEMLAEKLQEKLQNGKQVDLSVIEKYPSRFPDLHV